MPPPWILAESSSLDSAIHFVQLLIALTALPAVVGFFILFWHHFQAPGAGVALFLGLLTVLPATGVCGLIWWNDGSLDSYPLPGASLFVGLLVCALAWRASRIKAVT